MHEEVETYPTRRDELFLITVHSLQHRMNAQSPGAVPLDVRLRATWCGSGSDAGYVMRRASGKARRGFWGTVWEMDGIGFDGLWGGLTALALGAVVGEWTFP